MSPRNLRLLHADNQAYLVEHRWPPVWYLKDYDYYQKCLAERDKELKPSLKSGSGCLCFSRKSESDPALSSSQLWPGATARARLNSSSSPSHSLTPWNEKKNALHYFINKNKNAANYEWKTTVTWNILYTHTYTRIQVVLYWLHLYVTVVVGSTAIILKNIIYFYYWHIFRYVSSSKGILKSIFVGGCWGK